MGLSKTHETFAKEFRERWGDEYTLLSEYKGWDKPITCRHEICGNVSTYARAGELNKRKFACKNCSFENNIKRHRKDDSVFKKQLYNIYKDNIIALEPYIDNYTKICFRCKDCNEKFYTTPPVILAGKGCLKCNLKKRSLSHEEVVNRIKKYHNNIEVIGQYSGNSDDKIKVKCTIHDYIWENKVTLLIHRKDGCPICSNHIIVKGINDLNTTNKEVAKMLKNYEDGFLYSEKSTKKVDFICPNCNTVVNTNIFYVSSHRLPCPKCSDGFSYPNKFMFNILNNLGIKFVNEFSPDWADRRKYDFMFELKNKKYIIEMDGGVGHGNVTTLNSELSAKESKQIDELKDKMAKEHGYNMIRIDCVKSEYEYIKNNILNSELNNILNFTDYIFIKSNIESEKSKCISSIDLYNSGYSVIQIAEKLNINKCTVRTYLHRGTDMKLCDYNPRPNSRSKRDTK